MLLNMNSIKFPVEIIFWVPGTSKSISVIAHNSQEYAEIIGIYVRTYKSEQ